jgi:hypothetical protein
LRIADLIGSASSTEISLRAGEPAVTMCTIPASAAACRYGSIRLGPRHFTHEATLSGPECSASTVSAESACASARRPSGNCGKSASWLRPCGSRDDEPGRSNGRSRRSSCSIQTGQLCAGCQSCCRTTAAAPNGGYRVSSGARR